jgi:hypothetical protein
VLSLRRKFLANSYACSRGSEAFLGTGIAGVELKKVVRYTDVVDLISRRLSVGETDIILKINVGDVGNDTIVAVQEECRSIRGIDDPINLHARTAQLFRNFAGTESR